MKPRVDFPDGTYAVMREKVNVRGRKAMQRTSVPAMNAMRRIRMARAAQEIPDGDEPTPNEVVEYSEQEIHAMQRFEMAGVMAMLAHWTRDEPLPRTIDDVEEMEPEVYEAIAIVVRPELWSLLGGPAVGPDSAVDGQGRPAIDSPSGPSTDSNGDGSGDRATPASPHSETATATSSTGTGSTSSGDATPE